MKKIIFAALLVLGNISTTLAQKPAEIKFDKVTHDFGKFSEKTNPKVTCTFTFTNIGETPLVINRAMAACGCTAPEYKKEPVLPGEKGEIRVTYNATGRDLGPFKKLISILTNGAVETTRLYIKGEVTE